MGWGAQTKNPPGGNMEGGRGAGEKWREAGERGEGSGIPKVAGSRRTREKLCNMQYFAMEKIQRGRSQQIQGGNQD